jgi:hypothetical protein
MPYKNKTSITIGRKTKNRLDRMRELDESWAIFLEALLDYWIEEHQKIKKLDNNN